MDTSANECEERTNKMSGYLTAVFHGIGAYRGQRNPLALKRALDVALSGVELCGSDKAIGAFGAVFHGTCSIVWDQDVWSEVDEEGNRIATGWGAYDGKSVENPTQGDFESLAREAAHHYTEAWVCPIGIRALWVKDWAPKATKKAAEILAKNRKVPLLILGRNTRIWMFVHQL